ncbi:MAG: hypothetical protein LUE92_08325 [Clostridiales bacterium]|nr:hypothetical protein [Clostridiales bacterium]
MQNKKKILNLFLLLEVIILIIVIVVAVLFGSGISIPGRGEDSASSVNAGTASDNDNAIESESSGASDTESGDAENDNSVSGSSDQNVETTITFSDEVEEKLDTMTVEEQVSQLFITTPEELTGVKQVTVAGDSTQEALESYPVAGLVYSATNFISDEQIASMLASTQEFSQSSIDLNLFTIVEEIGGENDSPLAVALEYNTVSSPSAIGEEESPDSAYSAAQTKAEYVSEAGFNMLLAPVADVATGSDESFDEMTYGSQEVNVAEYVEMDVEGTQAAGVDTIVRAFPGIREATEDYSAYQAAVDAGASCIQVSNVTSSSLTGSSAIPCSLSDSAVSYLRDSMGYDGILMTSDLSDSAVLEYCTTEEAAVTAVNAGMDLVYVTDGFEDAWQAVLDAVNDGSISKVRLHNSVGRILSAKLD